jgi:hypothetical protein
MALVCILDGKDTSNAKYHILDGKKEITSL